MQHYLLPVAALLETMAGLQATVTLRAHLSALPKGWDEECIADLVMVHGTLHTCTISTVEGHPLLQREAALQMLERIGTLEWTMRAPSLPPPPQLQRAHPSESQQAPSDWKVVPELTPETLIALPRRHRQVLLLVENRTPEEIARLLQRSQPDVEQVLEELRQHHLIYSSSFERSRR